MATKYTVQKGDNLTRIAKKYNTSISAIMNANKGLIKDPNIIQVGWVLTIPVTSVTSPAPSTSDDALLKQLKTCLKDVENLDSFKQLCKML